MDRKLQRYLIDINRQYLNYLQVFPNRLTLLRYATASLRFTNGVIFSKDSLFYFFSRLNFAPFQENLSLFDRLESSFEDEEPEFLVKIVNGIAGWLKILLGILLDNVNKKINPYT